MPPLSRRALLYLVAVALAGPAALAAAMATWHAPLRAGPALPALLVALAVLAIHFPLQLAPRVKVNVAGAVHFGALLLLGTPAGVAVAGAGELLGNAGLILRRHPRTGRRCRRLEDTVFNTGQTMLATAVSGAVYFGCCLQAAPAPLTSLPNAWSLPLAAAAMYLVNGFAVAGMVALQLGQSAWAVWWGAARQDAVQFAGLYAVGALGAFTAADHPWSIALLVAPTVMLYLALRRQVQVTERTIAAVEAMADAVDLRDRYTAEHSARVAENAERLARALGLAAEEVEAIRRAARVHDLGKVAVPDSVLHKAGPLSPEQWELMKQHPETGYQILAQFREYRQGRELVRLHHERLDGRGYPHGVGGDQLPLGAQIIAVCDTFDAMTSDRPYRRGLPVEAACAEIRRGAGSQFHPRVAEAFVRLAAQPGPRPLAVARAA